jgi:3'(2'), 5'-bisphosphate nucleotidase
MTVKTMNDAELAAHLADMAGKLLLQVRAANVFADKALGKAGDATANQFLVHALREARPNDGLLSEEMKDDGERLKQKRVWIVDPVDGTREYGEGRTDWASGSIATRRQAAAHGGESYTTCQGSGRGRREIRR